MVVAAKAGVLSSVCKRLGRSMVPTLLPIYMRYAQFLAISRLALVCIILQMNPIESWCTLLIYISILTTLLHPILLWHPIYVLIMGSPKFLPLSRRQAKFWLWY